jgi:hypothetical protein
MRSTRRSIALRCVLGLWAGAALAAGAAACNLLLGTGSFTACTALGDAGWFDADCRSCVEAFCCDQAAACVADPACSTRQQCLAGGFPLLSCPLDSGVEAIAWRAPGDGGPAAALDACLATSCAARCDRGPWACVGFSSWPAVPSGSPGATVTVTIDPSKFSGYLCEPGDESVRIRVVEVCPTGDETSCTSFPNPAPDAGPFALPVPLGFQGGYLHVLPDSMGGDSDPLEALVYFTWPLAADTRVDLRFLTVQILLTAAEQGGVMDFDADAGTLVVLPKDCLGSPAAGVTLAKWPPLDTDAFIHSAGFSFDHCVEGQSNAQPLDAAAMVTTTDDGVAGWADMRTGVAATFTAAIDGGAFPLIAKWQPTTLPRAVTYVWLTPMPPQQP